METIPTPIPLTPSSEIAFKLLIIEDNTDVVTYLESVLSDSYELLIARDGEAGIHTAIEEVPDLIISDIMMPKKDGYEVCMTLKEDVRTSHIPIVLLTAKADEESRMDGLSRGADAYLTKPFNKQELFIRLEQLLKLRQKLQARYAIFDLLPPTQEVQIQQEDEFILKARKIIEDKMQDANFDMHVLQNELGVSRTQLYKKIKSLTNRSATHYIRMIRLLKAKEMLTTSELSITEIAYEVGFSDPSYFSRVFTEEFGKSPRGFVKN